MTPVRRPSEPSPPDRLRQLAQRDPEQVVIEKEILSAELRRIARELERAA